MLRNVVALWQAPLCFPRTASISVEEAKHDPSRANRNAAFTLCEEFQRRCRPMLSSRLKTMNSFDASAMVAIGIIVAQPLIG